MCLMMKTYYFVFIHRYSITVRNDRFSGGFSYENYRLKQDAKTSTIWNLPLKIVKMFTCIYFVF